MRSKVYSPDYLEANEIFDVERALTVSGIAGSLQPDSQGRRARKRDRSKQLQKAGYILPLLAAQGCLSVGKDGEVLVDGEAIPPELDPTNGGANTSEVIVAETDSFTAISAEPLILTANDLLNNDTTEDGSSLEIVRVFNAVNGEVMFDGAEIEFVADEGYEGIAGFQYEIRNANGDTTTGIVEIVVSPQVEDEMPGHMGEEGHGEEGHGEEGHGEEGHGDEHGAGGGHGDDTGSHAHPDDPDLAAEHNAVLNLVPTDQATHMAVNNGSWFDPNTWADGVVPGEGAQVHIPDGVRVQYDSQSDVSLFTVRVDGMLEFANDQDTFMEVDTFVVAPSGHVTIGTIDEPVDANFETVIQFADNGPIDVSWDPTLMSRGFISHGTLEIHGAYKDSHIRLAQDPMAGDTSLVLEGPAEGWEVGDRLVLTGTHLGEYEHNGQGVPHTVSTEDEELVITAINGNVITFDTPLAFDHDTPRDDLKAYVANYSRNVRFETENADDLPNHQRGHFMAMHNDDVDIRYAEFTDLGRTDKSFRSRPAGDFDVIESDSNVQGRYSLHIHRAGVSDLDDPVMVVGNAVWGSPGWGYVHHDSNAILAHNTSYDVFGAHFVAETGNETGRWVDNIAIKAHGVGAQGVLGNNPKSGTSDVSDFDLGRNGQGFWFQGRLVDAVDNVAAGSPGGHAFMYFHRGSGTINVEPETLNNPELVGYVSVDPDRPNISQFEGNEAIATQSGLYVVKSNDDQNHDGRSYLKDFTAWEVLLGVHTEYTAHYTFDNFDLISAEGVQLKTAQQAGFDTGVEDLVIKNSRIEGFFSGIFVPSKLPTDGNDVEYDRQVYLIDNTFVGYESDDRYLAFVDQFASEYRNLTQYDRILTGDEVSQINDAGSLGFVHDDEEFVPFQAEHFSAADLSGIKTDSLGQTQLGALELGGLGRQAIRETSVDQAILYEGYWSVPGQDGVFATAIERFYTDRYTGEQIKQSFFVSFEGKQDLRDQATYHGAYEDGNLGPTAVDDTATVAAGGSVSIDAAANDTDPEGDPLAVDGLGEARHGSVYYGEDGNILYVPDPNYVGDDQFTYFVEDDQGNFDSATVYVTVV